MHTNPFTAAGYDLRDLENKIQQKADRHEIHSIRSEMAGLERALHAADSSLAGLRDRCEQMEESLRRLDAEVAAILTAREEERAANSQFGVGA